MSLWLTEYSFVTCDEDITCEAAEMLWKYISENKDYTATFDVVKAMSLSVGNTIPKGEKHLLLLFVDYDGVAMEFHCREFVNKVMVKRKLYPDIMIKAFEEFKNKKYAKENNDNT